MSADGAAPIVVELIFVDGCPSVARARARLEDAMRLEGVGAALSLVRVDTAAAARDLRLPGSPSIRVNGRDLEGRDIDETAGHLGCRLYRDGARLVGWPSLALIRTALRRARARLACEDERGGRQCDA